MPSYSEDDEEGSGIDLGADGFEFQSHPVELDRSEHSSSLALLLLECVLEFSAQQSFDVRLMTSDA